MTCSSEILGVFSASVSEKAQLSPQSWRRLNTKPSLETADRSIMGTQGFLSSPSSRSIAHPPFLLPTTSLPPISLQPYVCMCVRAVIRVVCIYVIAEDVISFLHQAKGWALLHGKYWAMEIRHLGVRTLSPSYTHTLFLRGAPLPLV